MSGADITTDADTITIAMRRAELIAAGLTDEHVDTLMHHIVKDINQLIDLHIEGAEIYGPRRTQPMTEPEKNWMWVRMLGQMAREGEHLHTTFPGMLQRLLEHGAWQDFVTPRRNRKIYTDFEQFVITPPTNGLGSSLDTMGRLIEHDQQAIEALHRVLLR